MTFCRIPLQALGADGSHCVPLLEIARAGSFLRLLEDLLTFLGACVYGMWPWKQRPTVRKELVPDFSGLAGEVNAISETNQKNNK